MHSFGPFHVVMWLNKKNILYHVRAGKSLLLNLLDLPYFFMVARPFMFGRFGLVPSFLYLATWVAAVFVGTYFIELQSRKIFLNTNIQSSKPTFSSSSSTHKIFNGQKQDCDIIGKEKQISNCFPVKRVA
eukprot:TRINITY_DN66093_c0_g1_i1.p2 TRINITY_DN66093_c0_g1~~TRINITY_DN66093_c0_g1_i1.p2  ORF type:complete len:147 (+),score=11.74 TRINITY_DN66093_c0_g1_i1:54-443(+)